MVEEYGKRTLSSPLSSDCEVSSAPTVSTPQNDSTTPTERVQVECVFCPAPATHILMRMSVCSFCWDLLEVKGLTYDEVLDYWNEEWEHEEQWRNEEWEYEEQWSR